MLRPLLPALLLVCTAPALAQAAGRLSAREKVVAEATRALGEQLQSDGTVLVREAYARAGARLRVMTPRRQEVPAATLWRTVAHRKALKHRAPRPGDIVFFRDTFDANGDGKANDGPTHAGLVERVAQDGTVTFIHRAPSGRVVRSRLNLSEPTRRFDWRGGRLLNDFLRPAGKDMPAGLTGELFAGFGAASVLTGELQPGAQSVARKGKGKTKVKKPARRVSQREKSKPRG